MHDLGGLSFEAPRDVLSAIPGFEVAEFAKNREYQVCCGAGGGIKARDPDLAVTIAREKVTLLNSSALKSLPRPARSAGEILKIRVPPLGQLSKCWMLSSSQSG